MVGTGIGAAFQTNGAILRGARSWAGELGSIPMGKGMTLDMQASGAAILQNLRVDAEKLVDLVERGDCAALNSIWEAGEALGLGIATVINLLNPELVVLGGGTLRWQGYLKAALTSAQKHALPDLWDVCRIDTRVDDPDLVARGAMYAASSSATRT